MARRFLTVTVLMLIVVLTCAAGPKPSGLPVTVKPYSHYDMYRLFIHNLPFLRSADKLIARFGRSYDIREEIIQAAWQWSSVIWDHPVAKKAFRRQDQVFHLNLAQQAAESAFNPLAVSPKNRNGTRDFGLTQQNSRYLASRGITDWRNIDQQCRAQAYLMCAILQRTAKWGGERAMALAVASYTGARVGRGYIPNVGRTIPHTNRVMAYYRELQREMVPKPAVAGNRYIVRAGDTLWRIAQKHGTTVQNLARVNGIENPDLIRVGQELIVP